MTIATNTCWITGVRAATVVGGLACGAALLVPTAAEARVFVGVGFGFLLVFRVTITRPILTRIITRRRHIRLRPTIRLPARIRRQPRRRRAAICLRRQRRPRKSRTPHVAPGPTRPVGNAGNTKRHATYRDALRRFTGQPAAIQTASGVLSIDGLPDATPAGARLIGGDPNSPRRAPANQCDLGGLASF